MSLVEASGGGSLSLAPVKIQPTPITLKTDASMVKPCEESGSESHTAASLHLKRCVFKYLREEYITQRRGRKHAFDPVFFHPFIFSNDDFNYFIQPVIISTLSYQPHAPVFGENCGEATQACDERPPNTELILQCGALKMANAIISGRKRA